MRSEKDFQATFERLKILQKYEKRLTVTADKPGAYYLDAGYSEKLKRRIFFGAVTIKKNYVSFHLIPATPTPICSTVSRLRSRSECKASPVSISR